MTWPLEQLTMASRRSGYNRLNDSVTAGVAEWESTLDGGYITDFGPGNALGLDRQPVVQQALVDGLKHRSCATRAVAEADLAEWQQTESAIIYPSVSLAHSSAIPALLTRLDLVALDEFAPVGIKQAARSVTAEGTLNLRFAHHDPGSLERTLRTAPPYRFALVALETTSLISNEPAPLTAFANVAARNRAILYLDDARTTGLAGPAGRGIAADQPGVAENAIVVGSLGLALGSEGAFIATNSILRQTLWSRGGCVAVEGPISAPAMMALRTTLQVVSANAGEILRQRLRDNIALLTEGLSRLGHSPRVGPSPVVSLVFEQELQLRHTSERLTRRGFRVPALTYPAVPFTGGMLRFWMRADHTPAQIEGLLAAMRSASRPSDNPRVSAAA